MKTAVRLLGFLALGVLFEPAAAEAGMPMVTLTEVARMRVETISFFSLCFLASAGVIQGLWNLLRKDFTRLPRLSYGKAVGVVTLWGLLFLLVLTMISGARELMTPGAWKKEGFTYKLKDTPQPLDLAAPDREPTRRQALDRLRVALWVYARGHGGRFPADDRVGELPAEVWSLPGSAGLRYIYRGGLTTGEGTAVLAFEPGVFGETRLVLLTSGEIRSVAESDLRPLLDRAEEASR